MAILKKKKADTKCKEKKKPGRNSESEVDAIEGFERNIQ